VDIAGSGIALGAMVLLGVRAALRLELRWDTFCYHLPFAARRGGLNVPYDFLPYMQACYQGFPPLPEFVQGLLWRLTGSINATGVANYLALLLFLYFAWRQLGARLWIATLLCLTAPLVLIHAASSYVDLFSNAFLAIGVTAFLAMLLFDRWLDRKLLVWALAGLAAAAWSKYSTLPMVLLLFAGFLGVYARRARGLLRWVWAALLVALIPSVKNIVLYHNPTWPGGIPALAKFVPSLSDTGGMRALQSPPPLKNASQPVLFLHSLFEIGHPTSYPDRERWNIDQGNAWIAYRSGGFWVVGVITAALAAILLGFLSTPALGFTVAAAIGILWGVTSVLPQSHELRYFQFLPLSTAGLVAMLIPRVRTRYPATVLVISCLILGEFVYIARVNRKYYRVEKMDYAKAAQVLGSAKIWPSLERGKTYCAVGFAPIGFMLTGPTMHEYRIVDRPDEVLCPANTTVLRRSDW
jgi:hypothetical protein